jgi:hypothetical protein
MLCDEIDLPLVDHYILNAVPCAPSGTHMVITCSDENKRKHHAFQNLIMNHVPSEITVDHINHNPLDNRRSNLRLASRTIQAINQRVRKDNKTGIRGVHFDPKGKAWVAQWCENKEVYREYFSSAKLGNEEAWRKAVAHRKAMEMSIPAYREALFL